MAGPSWLRDVLMSSPDIRTGMAMLLAAVCAKGTSTINNADQIERGYERIDERLNALGARITRVPAALGACSLSPPFAGSMCFCEMGRAPTLHFTASPRLGHGIGGNALSSTGHTL